jgi:hypothetical protein
MILINGAATRTDLENDAGMTLQRHRMILASGSPMASG